MLTQQKLAGGARIGGVALLALLVGACSGSSAAKPVARATLSPVAAPGRTPQVLTSPPQLPTDSVQLVATRPDLPPRDAALVATTMQSAPDANGAVQNRRLNLPPGFQASIYAVTGGGPRFLAVSPEGAVVVTLQQGGKVVELVDQGNGYSQAKTVLTGLNQPSSITFHDGYLYVGEINQVARYPYVNGTLQPAGREVVVPGLPTGGHVTRTVDFGPDGQMYLAVGSSCNVCVEKDPRRAAITVYNADGSGARTFAAGLRNAVGFVWQTGTGAMWATMNGRDDIGADMGLSGTAATRATDDLPPDYVTRVTRGGNYGWPRCYGDHQLDPKYGDAAFCAGTLAPSVEIQAHSAPLGLAFYTGSNFPAAYRGDLFIALHGSWNRSVPTGHKVIRIHFENGAPVRAEDFATTADDDGGLWGRPAGVLVAPDGALLVSDDEAGIIYRIVYSGR